MSAQGLNCPTEFFWPSAVSLGSHPCEEFLYQQGILSTSCKRAELDCTAFQYRKELLIHSTLMLVQMQLHMLVGPPKQLPNRASAMIVSAANAASGHVTPSRVKAESAEQAISTSASLRNRLTLLNSQNAVAAMLRCAVLSVLPALASTSHILCSPGVAGLLSC